MENEAPFARVFDLRDELGTDNGICLFVAGESVDSDKEMATLSQKAVRINEAFDSAVKKRVEEAKKFYRERLHCMMCGMWLTDIEEAKNKAVREAEDMVWEEAAKIVEHPNEILKKHGYINHDRFGFFQKVADVLRARKSK